MKPSWQEAPSWAKWLAMDSSGTWCWYEDEPVGGLSSWYPMGTGRFLRHENQQWHETLEERP